MLEHARARQCPLLGDVADYYDRGACLLGDARELGRAFAHLGDRAGRGYERFRVDGLDRVDHSYVGVLDGDRGLDLLELDFRQQLEIGGIAAVVEQGQAPGTKGDLRDRLLTADIERAALAG